MLPEIRGPQYRLVRNLFAAMFAILAISSVPASAVEFQVAVAANFAVPAQKIAAQFERTTGHKAVLSFGSTGRFFTQIRSGAPFDILLAADHETPLKLAQDAVPGSQFTYAIGTLVLWSADPRLVDSEGAVLKQGHFQHLAIASPVLAPYGAAAMQTLQALHLVEATKSKVVQGESIGQTFAFVATGNAEIGFVALSQVWEGNALKSGSIWVVPNDLYEPIRQDAILLRHGADNAAARAFLDYLKTDAATAVMRAYGYQF